MIKPKDSRLLMFVVIIIAVVVVAVSLPNSPLRELLYSPQTVPDVVQDTERNLQPEVNKPDTAFVPEQAPEQRLDGRLQVQDVTVGTGPAAQEGSSVSLRYQGLLAETGEEFDRTPEGQTFDVVVGQTPLIEGFTEGLIGLRQGGERVLLIDASAAYGPRGVTQGSTVVIPPNADLVFLIEAVSVSG